jgi:hypothetical protein
MRVAIRFAGAICPRRDPDRKQVAPADGGINRTGGSVKVAKKKRRGARCERLADPRRSIK